MLPSGQGFGGGGEGQGRRRRRRHGIAGNERQDALSLYVRVRNQAYGVSTGEIRIFSPSPAMTFTGTTAPVFM